MTKFEFDLFWQSNEDWYRISEEGDFYLTPEAPPEAVESFENYKKQLEKKKHVL